MTEGRQGNGRFGPGNRANPKGRPKSSSSVHATVLRELTAPITVVENQKRRKVTKLAANAKQIANQGASGDLRAARMTVDMALRAEGDKEKPAAKAIGANDELIVARFVARLRETFIEEADDVSPID